MITVRRALFVLPAGVVVALAACDLALGLGDLKDRVPDAATTVPTGDADVVGDAAPNDGGRRDGAAPVATSCQGLTGPGLTDCGPNGSESCCTTMEVPGGLPFFRSNDAPYPATVSSFYLDRFEVTVGRFRAFIDATVDAGYRPAPGAGKHVHLNGGLGLRLTGSGGSEPGWNVSWNDNLPTTREKWTQDLSCDAFQTWPDAGGAPNAGDARPVNCVSWYQAYAFCIWDGGFLPSEAEWNYASAGGDAKRKVPWGKSPDDKDIDCTLSNFDSLIKPACSDAGPFKVGSLSPPGDGRWGHADLGGNVHEWTADAYGSPYVNPCDDCLSIDSPASRVYRGGSFSSAEVYTDVRQKAPAAWNLSYVGLRCARAF